MKAIIPVAGAGTKLRPHTYTQPKALIPLAGKTILSIIIDQLKENGFMVKYTHPNLLLISWASWCPAYVRSEIKKKTGVVVDGYGNKIDKEGSNNNNGDPSDPNELIFHREGQAIEQKSGKEYKAITSYKPSGLIYNENLLRKIEDKIHS